MSSVSDTSTLQVPAGARATHIAHSDLDPQDHSPRLSDEHRAMLRDHYGIAENVIVAREYSTVDESNTAEFKEAWLSALIPTLKRGPSICIPIWDAVSGKSRLPQLRPDKPRITSGRGRKPKIVKYEFPTGESLVLDVNPLLKERVLGTEDMFVTEGVLKADCAISHGLCCIGLLGVTGFRGRNMFGGVTALAGWQAVNLKRKVYISFDSDIGQKVEVQRAQRTLARFLAARGAEVYIITLPEGPVDIRTGKPQKTGLDDFFVRGGTVEELRALAKPMDEAARDEIVDAPGVEFAERKGAICVVERRDEVTKAKPLCNFVARIESTRVRDDGESKESEFVVSGVTDKGVPLPGIHVSTKAWDAMGWVTTGWHGAAHIAAGRNTKDLLRAALHSMSTSPLPQTVLHTHTGWKKIEGKWLFLMGLGALGEHGLNTEVVCRPGEGLTHAALEAVALGSESLRDDVRESLALLKIGPAAITAPLLAATYLAPLCEVLLVDFVMHLAGRTGAFKTELAALAQGHFGKSFDARALPGAWSSTANFMEKQAFMAKDMLCVMDDFKPAGTASDYAKMQHKAELFIRGQANRSARGRLTADIRARVSHLPRGLVLSTGEDIPNGESLQARMLLVNVAQADINTDLLSKAQQARNAGALARAMAGYVQWLAPQLDTLGEKLKARHTQVLETLRGVHMASTRTPSVVATLEVAAATMLDYAEAVDAITSHDRKELEAEIRAGLRAGLAEQASAIESQNPARRFIEIITDDLAAKRCHLLSVKSGGFESGLERFGWLASERESRPQGQCVGWVDLTKERVYLNPTSAYEFAVGVACRMGDSLGTSRPRLWKQLREQGMLERTAADGDNTPTKRVAGGVHGVLCLAPNVISVGDELTDEEQADAFEESLGAAENPT